MARNLHERGYSLSRLLRNPVLMTVRVGYTFTSRWKCTRAEIRVLSTRRLSAAWRGWEQSKKVHKSKQLARSRVNRGYVSQCRPFFFHLNKGKKVRSDPVITISILVSKIYMSIGYSQGSVRIFETHLLWKWSSKRL